MTMEEERKTPGINRIYRSCLVLLLFLIFGLFLFPETSYVEEIGHAAPEKGESHSNHSAMPPEIAPELKQHKKTKTKRTPNAFSTSLDDMWLVAHLLTH